MSNIERVPAPARTVVARPAARISLGERLQVNRTGRTLAVVEHRTLMRLAEVQSEGLVTARKLREVDGMAHDAMSGQAFLTGWARHLAGDDPMLQDELRFFSDQAKLGKGEVIADVIDTLRRQ